MKKLVPVFLSMISLVVGFSLLMAESYALACGVCLVILGLYIELDRRVRR